MKDPLRRRFVTDAPSASGFAIPDELYELGELFDVDVSVLENPKKGTVAYWAKTSLAAQLAIAEILAALKASSGEGMDEMGTWRRRGPRDFAPWDDVLDVADRIVDTAGDVADAADSLADSAWRTADGVVKLAGFGAAVVGAAGDVAAGATDVIESVRGGTAALADQLVPDDLPSMDEVLDCVGSSGPEALVGAAYGGAIGGLAGLSGGRQFLDDVAAGVGNPVGGLPTGGERVATSAGGGWALIRNIATNPENTAALVTPFSPAMQGAITGLAGAAAGGLIGGAVGTFDCLLHDEPLGDRVPVVAHDRNGNQVNSYWRRRPERETTVTASMATTKQVFGGHAPSAPPHMLTDVHFELVRLDERTPDGRLVSSEGFSVRDLPLSFSALFTTSHGDPGQAAIVGSIDEVTVEPDGRVWGQGWLLNEPDARRSGRLIQAGAIRGNSVELAGGRVDLTLDENDSMLMDFIGAKIAATTLVAKPAMEGCTVSLVDPGFDFGEDAELSEIAAEMANFTDMAPACFSSTVVEDVNAPSLRWFESPDLADPTQVTVTEDGRVFGHVALWDTPHLGNPMMRPPRSMTNYAYFTVGEVFTDGGIVATGPLVIGDEHAAIDLGWRDAVDFYSATSLAWADVAIGEDAHGVWVAGMVRPGTDAATLHAARASGVSGDWRRIGGNLELVAVLSVNAPGFPIPRGEFTDNLARSLTGLGMKPTVSSPIDRSLSLIEDVRESVKYILPFARRLEAERIARSLAKET